MYHYIDYTDEKILNNDHKTNKKLNLSYWEISTVTDPDQVVIIGAGMVGLHTAIRYKKDHPDEKVIILERAARPYGASTRNAGFACFGSVSEILADLDKMKEEEVIDLIRLRYLGLEETLHMTGRKPIHYDDGGGYEVFYAEDETLFSSCQDRLPYCNDLVYQACGLEHTYSLQTEHCLHTELPLIKNRYEGSLNPALLVQHLITMAYQLGIHILWGCEVSSIDGEHSSLDTLWRIKVPYRKLAVCTNAFTRDLFPDINLSPGRNIVGVTKPITGASLQGCYHYDEGYIYFRSIEDRLLIGGARNRWEERERTADFGLEQDIQDYLTRFIHEKIYPDKEVSMETWWSGILATGPGKKPIIEFIPECNAVLAVRMGGMGVAIAPSVGKKAADLMGKLTS